MTSKRLVNGRQFPNRLLSSCRHCLNSEAKEKKVNL